MVDHACNPSYGRKPKIRGSLSKPAWAKSETLISKITRGNKAGGMAQAVEHLPSKHEAFNSDPKLLP
jgi:hypothetical protein